MSWTKTAGGSWRGMISCSRERCNVADVFDVVHEPPERPISFRTSNEAMAAYQTALALASMEVAAHPHPDSWVMVNAIFDPDHPHERTDRWFCSVDCAAIVLNRIRRGLAD